MKLTKKADYFSDAHIDIWFLHNRLGFKKKNIGHIDELEEELVNWVNERKSDAEIVIYAGDTGNGWKWHELLIRALKRCYTVVIETPGNHDFYKSGGYLRDHFKVGNAGFNWASCPLWTNFRKSYGKSNQKINGIWAENNISDYLWIPEISAIGKKQGERWKITADENEKYWEQLLNYKLQVVVTHFPPILGSQHPKYEGNEANPYFVNDEPIRFNKVDAQYWFHGHTHDPFDYVKGKTRMLSWPIGYPTENYQWFNDVPIKTIEMELDID